MLDIFGVYLFIMITCSTDVHQDKFQATYIMIYFYIYMVFPTHSDTT